MTGGHFGISKTLDQIQRRCYWTTWIADTTRYCRRCDPCSTYHRGSAPKQAEMQLMTTGHPMERVGIDLCGPFPPCEGNKYILTMICHFQKWAIAIPIPNKEAKTIAMTMVQHWISLYDTIQCCL